MLDARYILAGFGVEGRSVCSFVLGVRVAGLLMESDLQVKSRGQVL